MRCSLPAGMSEESSRSLRRDVNSVVGTVLRTPARFLRLMQFGPQGLASMTRFLAFIVPRASRELARIRTTAKNIPDPDIREQAIASITEKAFHVEGGSILATFLHGRAAQRYVEIVAPLETIYDYLDNLCDRLAGVPYHAYPTLHEALLDALDDRRVAGDYYRDGPHADDGGYLRGLVESVRIGLRELPHYARVRDRLLEIGTFYAELQTFKHAAAGEREIICAAWYARHEARFPGLHWWEFAAACGSSMPVFALIYLASQSRLSGETIDWTVAAYFPNFSAVHILLDYFIDQAEDRAHHELNFVACYPSAAQGVDRIALLVSETVTRIRALPDAPRHAFVLKAMCLFYLTHPKVYEQGLEMQGSAILAALG
jgi:tetraprenyl-beta-curcumene synthase